MSAAQAATAMKQTAQTPAYTARVGNVEIAIWRNQGANGEFYTASPPKIRYKDEKGEWKDSSSYGMLDLLALAECAREASTKIRELKA
jgi:hypothetical protein